MSPTDEDEARHVTGLQTSLQTLYETHGCNICHTVLTAPVKLRCEHIFCAICVRRHLISHSVCPHPHCEREATSLHITPLRHLDAALAPLRRAVLADNSAPTATAHMADDGYLVFLSAKVAGAKAKLMEELRRHDLPLSGKISVLANRHRQFVINWNANLDSAAPQSKLAIADLVMKEESMRDDKSTQVGNHRGNSFFKKRRPQPIVLDASDSDDDDVVAEGDSFETLIRKTRKRKLRQMREAQKISEALAKKVRTQEPQHYAAADASKAPAVQNSNKATVVTGVCSVDIPCGPEAKLCTELSPQRGGCVNANDNRTAFANRSNGPGISSAPVRRHRISPPANNSFFMPMSERKGPACASTSRQSGENNSYLTPMPQRMEQSFSANRTGKLHPFFAPASQMQIPSAQPSVSFAPTQNAALSQGNMLTGVHAHQTYGPSAIRENLQGRHARTPNEPCSIQREAQSTPSKVKVQRTEEMNRMIEQKRLMAIERKKRYYERLRLQNAQPSQPQ